MLVEKGEQLNLSQMNNRLDHLEDLMTEVLESGREMDANITSQIEDLKYDIEMQHDLLKKLKKTRFSPVTKLMILITVIFVCWIIFLFKY